VSSPSHKSCCVRNASTPPIKIQPQKAAFPSFSGPYPATFSSPFSLVCELAPPLYLDGRRYASQSFQGIPESHSQARACVCGCVCVCACGDLRSQVSSAQGQQDEVVTKPTLVELEFHHGCETQRLQQIIATQLLRLQSRREKR
jgi:hypothetical protein